MSEHDEDRWETVEYDTVETRTGRVVKRAIVRQAGTGKSALLVQVEDRLARIVVKLDEEKFARLEAKRKALAAERAERAERRARRNDDCWARPKEPCRCATLPCRFRLQRIAGTHTFAPHALVHADTKHFAPPVKIGIRHRLRTLLRRIRVFLGV